MITLERHDNGRHGYVKALNANNEAGRMTFTWAGDTKLIIDHTEVNSEFSGTGVGKKMLLNLVELAREKGIKIVPVCPFAKAMFARDASISDVLV